MKIHCLGGGLVGSFVIRRLINAGFNVHIFDIENVGIEGAIMHVGDAISADHKDADLIINMLPGDVGHLATSSLSMSGQRVLDLSFSASTPDSLSKKR